MKNEKDYMVIRSAKYQRMFVLRWPEGHRSRLCFVTGSWTAVFSLVLIMVFCATSITHGLGRSLVVANFARQTPRDQNETVPKGWKIKAWQGLPDVALVQESEGKVLRLRSQNASISVFRKLRFNPKKFPIMKWSWKVTKLPVNADARLRDRDDQAAGVYVVFPGFPSFINSRIIAYVWDSSVPEGRIIKSQKNPMVQYIVVRSGSEKIGEWINEVRNVVEDYRKVYGQQPSEIGGVSLMIDSDDTRSEAESYFSRIEFERDASVRLQSGTSTMISY